MRIIQLGFLLVLLSCANQPTSQRETASVAYAPKNLKEMTRQTSFKLVKDEISLTGSLHIHEAMPGALDAAGKPDNRACVYANTISKVHKKYSNWNLKLVIDGKAVALQSKKITTVTTFDEAGKIKNDPGLLVLEACSKNDYLAVKTVRFELRNKAGKKLAELSWAAPWPPDGVTPEQKTASAAP